MTLEEEKKLQKMGGELIVARNQLKRDGERFGRSCYGVVWPDAKDESLKAAERIDYFLKSLPEFDYLWNKTV